MANIHRPILIAALALAGLAGGRAQAASQVLGLVASLRPTPMACTAAGCRAALSAFCLQQARPDPTLGTVYLAAPGAPLTLVVTSRTGETRHLDATRYLAFVGDRGFTSVTARLPAAALAGLAAAAVAIEVGRDASLLPAPKAGDDNPQGEDEVALATGPNRAKAEPFFDRPGRDADAIRLTNAMINELPAVGWAKTDTDGRLLSRVEDQYRGAPVDPAGRGLAERIHGQCVTRVDVTHHMASMRACLEGSHDVLVTHTNIDYWRSLGGS
jgi:hypothetical protein